MTTRLHLVAIAALLGVTAGCNLILGTEPPATSGTGGADGGTGSGGDAGTGAAPCGDAEWTHWDPRAKHAYARHTAPDGTSYVRDALTGLAWQSPGNQAEFTIDEARGHCKTLTWGGLEGYRLPTMVELASLTRYDATPALDPAYFTDEPGGDYWTSTFSNAVDGYSVYVSHGDGRIRTRFTENNQTAGVRCVKDLKPAADLGCVRYVSVDDDTGVRDIETGLVWQRTAVVGMKTWANAKTACASAAPEGQWRLPEVYELITLLDVDANSKSGIDPQFFPVKEIGDYYWSATPSLASNNNAWDVDTAYFYAEPGLKSDEHYVRCVR